MPELIRVLNEQGAARLRDYLAHHDAGGAPTSAPFHLLSDEGCSAPFEHDIEIERMPRGKSFADRYELGCYLRDRLAVVDRTQISRDYELWNWLSLFYFDQICPPASDGSRRIHADEVYVLTPDMQYRQYFRHLVRAPWIAACEHGENGKVLLIHADRGDAPLSTRGAIFEQLASRQGIFNNPTVIAAAQRLFFDERNNRPRFGVSGQTEGSVRRFAIVVQQLELTFDTRACSVEQLIALLPREFDQWKQKAGLRL